MPEIKIHIGGREFDVVCKKGEEPFLESAAAMLDAEAQALSDAMGRIPESRMLLMAGLMLADKTASLEDQVAASNRQNEGGPLAAEVTAEIAQLKGDLAAATKNLEATEIALAEAEEQAAAYKTHTTTAFEAMERMTISVEKMGA